MKLHWLNGGCVCVCFSTPVNLEAFEIHRDISIQIWSYLS